MDSVEGIPSPYDGERGAYQLAAFRIVFYGGLMIHFVPSVVEYDLNYGAHSLRSVVWDRRVAAWVLENDLSPIALVTSAALGCTLGLLGLWPRLAATLAAVGLYGMVNVSMVNTHTLALTYAWFVLWTWAAMGGGDDVLSLRTFVSNEQSARVAARAGTTMRTRTVLLVYLVGALFIAGIEKILAGWAHTLPAKTLLLYPEGTVVRSYLVGLPEPWLTCLSACFGVAALVVELGAPIAAAYAPSRNASAAVTVLFFLCVTATMQVPLLFLAIHLGVGVLLVDDNAVRRVRESRLVCPMHRTYPSN
jgi:hypothetical protein